MQPKRRRVLAGLAVLAAGRWWHNPLWRAGALVVGAGQLPAQAEPAVVSSTPVQQVSPQFMRFSQGITEHGDLNTVTGARIEAALKRQVPGFDQQIATLDTFTARQGQPMPDAQALLAAANDAGLHDLVMAIVSAWYTGTVGAGNNAVVVSYREALMYRPVADGQVVPTYCNYGPQWWTQAPPSANVAPPKAPKAPPPATTGTPEPKATHP